MGNNIFGSMVQGGDSEEMVALLEQPHLLRKAKKKRRKVTANLG